MEERLPPLNIRRLMTAMTSTSRAMCGNGSMLLTVLLHSAKLIR
jgi:hypothetical protein